MSEQNKTDKIEEREDHEGKIVLIPQGAVEHRIRTIASTIHIARKYKRPLEVIWHSNDLLPASSDRLFTLLPRVTQENITIRQGVMRDKIINSPPSNENLFLTWPFVTFRYDRHLSKRHVERLLRDDRNQLDQIFANRDEKLLISTDQNWGNFPYMYDALEATVEVNNVLLSRMSSWKGNVIGVHINRTIGPKSSFQESPIELFIKRMQEMVESDPTIQFFIATTSKDERERLATLFRDRIFVPHSAADVYSLKGTIQSLGELLALSHTRKILTTPDSVYSQVASEIGRIPIEALSIYSNPVT